MSGNSENEGALGKIETLDLIKRAERRSGVGGSGRNGIMRLTRRWCSYGLSYLS